uniref:Non-haem dioxygenase N-terminal domain-containing protein n=1 Tax=Timspurckia oligopyrenoides TaxID=708627 RepID=A0A7S0ZEV0_9RHOD|mmetsp:Transcript_2433/g.4256  ORF Transcript_2433/g.4256 Transcript_2433/m.4256 type:complete len:192 (+) Transcript_2433:19-594(+)
MEMEVENRMKAGEERVPVIDLSSYFQLDNYSDGDRENASRKLDQVCGEVGLFKLRGTGILKSKAVWMLDWIRRFFESASNDIKYQMELDRKSGRGYQKLGQNVTKGEPDQHEGIDMYHRISKERLELMMNGFENWLETKEKQEMFMEFASGNNRWPEDQEWNEMRDVVLDWIEDMKRVGYVVMKALQDATR